MSTSMLSPANGVLTSILEYLSQLVRKDALLVSSALALGPFDTLAATSRGIRHMRFLPWCNMDFEDFGPLEQRADTTFSTLVTLGTHNVDVVEHASPLRSATAGGPSTNKRKLRRLDGLFGSVAPAAGRVEALFVGEETDRALAILEGATGVLSTHRPAIVLPLDGSPAANSVATLLDRAGYHLFDQHLRTLVPTDPIRLSWALAVPSEVARTVVPRVSSCVHFPVWTIPIDGPLARRGFHPVEGAAPATWSWIGPRPSASLLLPGWAGPLARLQLNLRAVADRVSPAGAQAAIDSIPALVKFAESALEIEVLPSIEPRAYRQLDLSFPTSVRSLHDRRLLVVAVAAVRLGFAAE